MAMAGKDFFSEEASRQILARIASVFNDPDLCDAIFVLGAEKEEICTPSQFMAVASPKFKSMFYPPSGNRKEVPEVDPKIFRKILDYLFRGRVGLGSIEDAWRVKAAGRHFELKDLEDLCAKFLKYRLDSTNLISYLRNTYKYNAPDIRDVVITRFGREANQVMSNDQVLDLSQEELVSLLETKPDLQAATLMDVLFKWCRKRYGLDPVPAPAPAKKPRVEGEEGEGGAAGEGDGDAAAAGENGNGEAGEKEKEPEPEINFIKPQKPFVKFLKWDKNDGEYFLKKVKGRKVMELPDENDAMAQIIESFMEAAPLKVTPVSTPSSRNRPGPKRRR